MRLGITHSSVSYNNIGSYTKLLLSLFAVSECSALYEVAKLYVCCMYDPYCIPTLYTVYVTVESKSVHIHVHLHLRVHVHVHTHVHIQNLNVYVGVYLNFKCTHTRIHLNARRPSIVSCR